MLPYCKCRMFRCSLVEQMEPIMTMFEAFAATDEDFSRQLDQYLFAGQAIVDMLKAVRDRALGEPACMEGDQHALYPSTVFL